jgi:hypothetical protein
MKEVKGGFDGPRAVTWEEGRVVAGFFMVADKIEGVESRKLNFDATGKGDMISCWETAALKSIFNQVKPGDYVVLQCLGKKKFKNGRGWDFKVSQPESGSETQDCVKKYGPTMTALRDTLEANRPQDVPKT